MLDLTMNFAGNQSVIHPTLMWDEDGAVLVDTGMPGQLQDIRTAMQAAGVPFERLKAVILTHQDIDHIGGLPEILAAAPHKIEVYAHELDVPYIEGERDLIKMNRDRVAQLMANLPEPERARFEQFLLNRPTAKVDKVLRDGDEIPLCGGVQVIFTPGHTPGHICLYLKATRTVIAGDATVSQDGRLQGPSSRATPDMETAWKSLGKLLNYDIEQVICYHGGLCSEDIRGQLQALLNR